MRTILVNAVVFVFSRCSISSTDQNTGINRPLPSIPKISLGRSTISCWQQMSYICVVHDLFLSTLLLSISFSFRENVLQDKSSKKCRRLAEKLSYHMQKHGCKCMRMDGEKVSCFNKTPYHSPKNFFI